MGQNGGGDRDRDVDRVGSVTMGQNGGGDRDRDVDDCASVA